MDTPKAAFDTNLYLTYLLSSNPLGTTIDRLLEAAADRRFELQLPINVIIELNSVAERPRMSKRISHRKIELLLRRILEFATLLPIMEEEAPRVCRDPDDDFLIAVAIAHGTNFLVTRDRDLLALESVLAMRIVDPATFLELISLDPEAAEQGETV